MILLADDTFGWPGAVTLVAFFAFCAFIVWIVNR